MTAEQRERARVMWLCGAFTNKQIGATICCPGSTICVTAARQGWTRSPEALRAVRERRHRARSLTGSKAAKGRNGGYRRTCTARMLDTATSGAVDADFDTI